MDPPMHIGIYVEIFLTHGIKHTERFLCGGRIIEIDQWLIVNSAREDRKICPHSLTDSSGSRQKNATFLLIIYVVVFFHCFIVSRLLPL